MFICFFLHQCNGSLRAMSRLAEILPCIVADGKDKTHVQMIVKNLKALNLPKVSQIKMLDSKK